MNNFQSLLQFSMSLKPDESFGIVVEDAANDSLSTDYIDNAFGAVSVTMTGKAPGGVRYISLSGTSRLEKLVKVARYQHLITQVAQMMDME